MLHELKLKEDFADAIADGRKTFEVRENDRGFQAGDTVEFVVVDRLGLEIGHPLTGREMRITYVLSGWGIKEGYVVFGISFERNKRKKVRL